MHLLWISFPLLSQKNKLYTAVILTDALWSLIFNNFDIPHLIIGQRQDFGSKAQLNKLWRQTDYSSSVSFRSNEKEILFKEHWKAKVSVKSKECLAVFFSSLFLSYRKLITLLFFKGTP